MSQVRLLTPILSTILTEFLTHRIKWLMQIGVLKALINFHLTTSFTPHHFVIIWTWLSLYHNIASVCLSVSHYPVAPFALVTPIYLCLSLSLSDHSVSLGFCLSPTSLSHSGSRSLYHIPFSRCVSVSLTHPFLSLGLCLCPIMLPFILFTFLSPSVCLSLSHIHVSLFFCVGLSPTSLCLSLPLISCWDGEQQPEEAAEAKLFSSTKTNFHTGSLRWERCQTCSPFYFSNNIRHVTDSHSWGFTNPLIIPDVKQIAFCVLLRVSLIRNDEVKQCTLNEQKIYFAILQGNILAQGE